LEYLVRMIRPICTRLTAEGVRPRSRREDDHSEDENVFLQPLDQ
jgi:hypothetical protein